MKECPVCGERRLQKQVYLECTKCEAHLLDGDAMDENALLRVTANESIEECIKHYEAEECRFDDPKRCAATALRYAERMPSSHVRALLYTLARQVVEQEGK